MSTDVQQANATKLMSITAYVSQYWKSGVAAHFSDVASALCSDEVPFQ